MAHINGYADWMVEATREQLGYSPEDSSHDNEVLEKLQSGEKISKSKHMGQVSVQELHLTGYVTQDDTNNSGEVVCEETGMSLTELLHSEKFKDKRVKVFIEVL